MSVNWVGLFVVATLSVAAYFAVIAFGEGILPFLLFAAVPIWFFLTRPKLLHQIEQPGANTDDASDSLERDRALASDGAAEAGEISIFTPLLAIGFGMLSFLSPCCLPLLPAYVGMIAGSAGTVRDGASRWGLLWNGLAFVAGLSIVFAILGASASALGLLLLQQRLLLMQVGGVVIVLFGLQMLGILRFGWLARTYLHVEPQRLAPSGGMAGAFVVGAAFSIRWTPCIGLFLGSLLTLAAQQQTVAAGTLLLMFYGLGLGIPFVAAGLAADRALRWSRGLRRQLGLIERAGGVILVAMGILLFTGELTLINVWAIRTFGLGLAL